MFSIVIFSLFVIGGSITGVVVYLRNTESGQRSIAEKEYESGKYAAAAMRYRNMAKRWSDSPHAEEYRFLGELADMQAQFESVTGVAKPDDALERAAKFLQEYEQNPLLQQHQEKFSQALLKLLGGLANTVKGNEAIRDRKLIEKANQALAAARQAMPDAFTGEAVQQSEVQIAEASEVIEARMQRDRVVAQLEQLAEKPSAETVRAARELVNGQAVHEPNFPTDGKVVEILQRLYDGHAGTVTYTSTQTELDRPQPEETQPSILIEQLVDGFPGPHRPGDPVALALVRGVLYGLSQSNGRILWAMRVGIDTGTLPIRLPPTEDRPESVLVQSADTQTLTAVDVATGTSLWRHRLNSPSLGRPVVVGRRAYIATYNGEVHEIELALGQLLGRYKLAQPLSVGGAHQEGTSLVYFPADDSCVYILDVAARKCQAVLYTEHRSGSLRSEPILAGPGAKFRDVPLDPAAPQGYLILSEVSGLETMDLRVFGLPITSPTTAALTLLPQPRLRGWPWFQPYHDGEKLVMASDAGVVGLFGIRQLHNQDAALFPMLSEEFHLAPPTEAASLLKAGRAQVVHAQESDFWVLAQGVLQRLQLYIDPQAGRKLAPVWPEVRELGSPLHAGQVNAAGNMLFLVTQSPRRQAALATAVEAESGTIRWQRQLGVVAQSEPIALGDTMLVMDQGGSVFAFALSEHPDREGGDWQVGGRRLSGPVQESSVLPPTLVPSPDGDAVYQIAFPGVGTQMLLRRFAADPEGRVTFRDKEDRRIDLGVRPVGRPAVGTGGLLLALEDGTTLRLRLPATAGGGVNGPDWRAGRSLVDLKAHLVWLNDESYLATDGGRGVSHWLWPRNKPWKSFPADKAETEPTRMMRARVIAPPLVLSPEDGKIRVCIADADGTLTLLKGDMLDEVRRWELGGKITAGPFLRDGSIGVIVDRKRLVWIDPGKAPIAWEHKAGEEIVGEPRVIAGMVVIADQSGRFLGVDPLTGLPHGMGYSVKASVAPAATPVGFGKGRLFAPLTDGTILLLSMRQLDNPLADIPIAW